MGDLFYIASKTLGLVARVETWWAMGLILGLWAIWRGRRRAALVWIGAVTVTLLALGWYPLANPMLSALEETYPPAPLLTRVDGIIVLGGSEDLAPFARWGGVQMNDAAERMVAGVTLARQFPNSRLIYTGGTASLWSNPDPSAPSRMVTGLWRDLGVPAARIEVEALSRTTSENARFTFGMVKPQPGQVWVLVTSAWHMPRSMETFQRAGWTGLVPWPVDYRSRKAVFRSEWRLDDHLLAMDLVLKEELGRLAYWMAGK